MENVARSNSSQAGGQTIPNSIEVVNLPRVGLRWEDRLARALRQSHLIIWNLFTCVKVVHGVPDLRVVVFFVCNINNKQIDWRDAGGMFPANTSLTNFQQLWPECASQDEFPDGLLRSGVWFIVKLVECTCEKNWVDLRYSFRQVPKCVLPGSMPVYMVWWEVKARELNSVHLAKDIRTQHEERGFS